MKDEKNIYARRWGHYHVLDEGVTLSEDFKVKMLYLESNKSISKQYHNHREEYWIIMQGTAEISLDSVLFTAKRGDMIKIPKRTIHKITNPGLTELIILELQIGTKTVEDDIIRLEVVNGEV